ncbi:hypothetical protein AB1Y20_000792 [Prymnesium parvum]|uniref:Phospholipase A(1) n=1 Tax=Prymnesium parvum TaxID=97485 RepID=A0AB34KAP6_PRYPA
MAGAAGTAGALCLCALFLAAAAVEHSTPRPPALARPAPPPPSRLPRLHRTPPHRQLLLALSVRDDVAAPLAALCRRLAEQLQLLLLVLLRLALIDVTRRGSDQRRPWILALAGVHPGARLAATAAALWLALSFWLRRDWASDAECVALRLVELHLCGALLKTALALALFVAAVGRVLVDLRNAAIEEAKDEGLSEEFFAAACASAAYFKEPDERLAELHARGVESRNWRVDRQLSTETVCILFNWYTQSVWVAFRGTWSLEDWASNIVSIVPGVEMHDPRFQANLKVARAAQHKYVLFKSIRLTGHSRGGNMADLFGRTLGLRSISINPATWGKLFTEQEPPVESITTRTADIISVMETFSSYDRKVRFLWPRGATPFLLLCISILLCRAVLHALFKGALPRVLLELFNVAWIVALCIYLTWMHSVLRFTKK